MKKLFSFESTAEVQQVRANGVHLQRVRRGATDGR